MPVNHGLDILQRLASEQPLDAAAQSFLFLRHGQTACNLARLFQGPEEPLNAAGHAQALAAAEALTPHPPDRIVASPFRRARQTAAAVAAATGRPVTHAQGLRERDFGALIGTSSQQIDWSIHPIGGESLPAFVGRTRAALTEALNGGGTPLIVAHGGTLLVLTAALGLINVPVPLRNALPLRFTSRGGRWRVAPVAGPAGQRVA